MGKEKGGEVETTNQMGREGKGRERKEEKRRVEGLSMNTVGACGL